MASTFSWLDFSEGERRQVMEVIDQFSDEDTRDELGIGTVRDSLADLLFPGTSTIQTRARYFLFIPWIYLKLERRKIGYSQIAKESRKSETVLIDKLLDAGSDVGVIGARSRGKLQRLPSSAYWAGLRTWGILQLARSKDEYHRWLDIYYDQLRHAPTTDESNDEESIGSANWHPHIPPSPEAFPDGATFDLTIEEADYLSDRIRQKTAGSLLAHYVSYEIMPEGPFPWQDQACRSLPNPLRNLVDHAQHFSETMHGAALLYNLLLAESHPQFTDLCKDYRDRLSQWWAAVPMMRTSRVADQRDTFWSLIERNTTHRVPLSTKTFVNHWHEMVMKAEDESSIVDDSDARVLIKQREVNVKRGRARIGNQQMLQDWGGKSGTAQLNFRWPTSSQIIADIVRPLKD